MKGGISLNWIEGFNAALAYIENNLDKNINYDEISCKACCSLFYFSRIFTIMTGTSISDYIRRRRMSLAAIDLINTNEKIIEIAMKYGYMSNTSRSEEHTSELQSRQYLVCRLLLEKKKDDCGFRSVDRARKQHGPLEAGVEQHLQRQLPVVLERCVHELLAVRLEANTDELQHSQYL